MDDVKIEKLKVEQARLNRDADAITTEMLAFAKQIGKRLTEHAADVTALRRAGVTVSNTHWSPFYTPKSDRGFPIQEATFLREVAAHLPAVVTHEHGKADRAAALAKLAAGT